jgi:hypothetical protein
VRPRRRHQRREPFQEFQRLEHEVRRPVRPRPFIDYLAEEVGSPRMPSTAGAASPRPRAVLRGAAPHPHPAQAGANPALRRAAPRGGAGGERRRAMRPGAAPAARRAVASRRRLEREPGSALRGAPWSARSFTRGRSASRHPSWCPRTGQPRWRRAIRSRRRAGLARRCRGAPIVDDTAARAPLRRLIADERSTFRYR